MRRKTVRGLVLEKSGKEIILLTRDGEFIRVPARGRPFSPGMEVEVDTPRDKKLPFLLSAGIAAALFIAVALHLMGPALTGPEAYLALDINPGIVLSLDKNGTVMEAKPTNEEGAGILEMLEVEGADVLEYVDTFLEAAHTGSYLSAGRDNIVIASLAAPQNYCISENDLHVLISDKLITLQVDTYLKITVTGLDRVREAERMDIPLNALILGEKMKERIQTREGRSLLEGAPPLPVRNFLQTVDPADIFSEEQFVAGEGRKEGKKPVTPPPPAGIPGIPFEKEGKSEGEQPAGDAEPGRPADIPKPPPAVEQEIPANEGQKGQ